MEESSIWRTHTYTYNQTKKQFFLPACSLTFLIFLLVFHAGRSPYNSSDILFFVSGPHAFVRLHRCLCTHTLFPSLSSFFVRPLLVQLRLLSPGLDHLVACAVVTVSSLCLLFSNREKVAYVTERECFRLVFFFFFLPRLCFFLLILRTTAVCCICVSVLAGEALVFLFLFCGSLTSATCSTCLILVGNVERDTAEYGAHKT